MNEPILFGPWLKQTRRARGLTQAQLAAHVGCAAMTIVKIEAGDRRPSRQIATLLADWLGIPPAEQAAFAAFARGEVLAGTPPGQPAPARDPGAPWRAGQRPPNNLPAPLTSFVGRAAVVAAASAVLRRPGVRLLTLTGPPGIGKTRLSLEVARTLLPDFPDGVCYVPLAPVHDPDLVAFTIVQALKLREQEGQILIERLTTHLRDRQLLLVLDNFEQLMPAAPLVTDLLQAAPGLKVLVTSREVLYVYGEHNFPVPPLTLPAAPAPEGTTADIRSLLEYEAIRLFAERAAAGQPDFALTLADAPTVAAICARLDGLPLAIELAAGRVKALPPPLLLDRLSRRLDLLDAGPRDLPPRQQALRSAIAWSYDLLDPAEQALFRRLAVFAGGATPAAVGEVVGELGVGEWGREVGTGGAGDDQTNLSSDLVTRLTSLVNQSLLQQAAGGGDEATPHPRFWMLETLREYAWEQLEASGEAATIQQRHAATYMALADAAQVALKGPDQAHWLDRLESEHANLRAALEWSQATPDADGLGVRLVAALILFWELRGYPSEGREWATRVLAHADAAPVPPPPADHAAAYITAGRMAFLQGDYAAAQAAYQRSLALRRALDDLPGTASVLNSLGVVALAQGDYATARSLHEEGLQIRRMLDDQQGLAASLNSLGIVTLAQGDYVTARALYEESLGLRRALGNQYGIAGTLLNLGEAARYQGDYAAATARYEESLAISRELGDKDSVAGALHNLAHVAHQQGTLERAAALFAESLTMFQDLGDKRGMIECLAGLAAVAVAQGRWEQAVRLFGATDAALSATGLHIYAVDRVTYDQARAVVQAQVSEFTWTGAYTAGQGFSLVAAVTEVLTA